MSASVADCLRVDDVLKKVDVPEGEVDGAKVERFEIKLTTVDLARASMKGRGLTKDGTYTRLVIDGRLWMSDTDDERKDHMDAVAQALALHNSGRKDIRVLIGGLGIGMVVAAMIRIPGVSWVDVVESDERVVALVGEHYRQMAKEHGVHLNIVTGDMMAPLSKLFGRDDTWDVAWFDIWIGLDTDNLAEMATLARRYTRRCDWMGFWCKDTLKRTRERERRYRWWVDL